MAAIVLPATLVPLVVVVLAEVVLPPMAVAPTEVVEPPLAVDLPVVVIWSVIVVHCR